MRALTTFREPLKKRQIMELASQDVRNSIEMAKSNPIETQIFFKRLKVYCDQFISDNEKAAIEEFEKDREKQFDGADIHFTQGAALLDYSQDLIYAELAEQLADRKKMLDMAFKMKEPFYDKEGVQVPKVKVKGYRKDTLNVRL
jgi:hypothetical protein